MPDPLPNGDESGLRPSDQVPTAGPSPADQRYRLGEALPDGSCAVRDVVLDRGVAGRMAPASASAELEQEARFLARLDHAGAPQVLDLHTGPAGTLLVTRRTEGMSLAEAVALAGSGSPPPEVATPATTVVTMLKVCEVVAAAHARGIVHHDISPGRILLGSHGQVTLLGWERAMEEGRSPSTLRYVSSQVQGRSLSLDGMHEDVRAIGVCLFLALVQRPPAGSGEDALGRIQPDERVRIPVELEAIVRRAASSGPGSGYARVADLAQDLERFLGGTAPAAYRPGAFERAAGAMRRHRRPISVAAAAVCAAALAAHLAWGGAVRDWASWSTIASEDFSDDGWRSRWIEPQSPHGMFERREGRLVSVADRDAFLILRRRLTTPAAIEYTGEMLPGSQPCDLSVQWSEASGVAEDPGRFERDGRSYMIQAGAFGNSFCAIYQNPGRRLMAHANLQLEPGRRYRFRVELDGRRLSLSIDGKPVLEASDDIPTRSGFISLYGFYPGKAFDDVRVMQRRPPTAPTALDAGDAAFLERRYAQAADHYARAAEAGIDEQDALFRKGFAEWSLGQGRSAAATWERVSDPRLAERIASIRLESLFNAEQRTPHASWFEDRYRDAPDRRAELRSLWCGIVQQQLDAPTRNQVAIDYLLGVRSRLFPEDGSCRFVAAMTLFTLRRYDEVLQQFPEQRNPCARSMLALGRSRELVELPWVGTDERVHALGMIGEFDRVLATPGLMPIWRIRTLIRQDRLEEALRCDDADYPVLLHSGGAAALLDRPGVNGPVANEALISLGRLQQAAGDGAPGVAGSGGSVTAMLLLGQIDLAERISGQARPAIRFMQAAERRDGEAYAALHDRIALPQDLGATASWFAPVAMRPFVDAMHGDRDAVDRQLRPQLPVLDGIYSRSAWHVARVLLGDAPPESIGRMPCRYDAPAFQAVAAGMRAELAGHRDEAGRAYAAFTALPMHRRLLNQHQPDVDVEWFVAWRLRELAKAPGR